ncbi:MAG: flagellar M-ring protein FliF [Spirochaetaceae bacterium]|jgi:flagellar M-ring protein FliF|nr:flagellar M-ring protein FliF [Spirochaetaceae bacterium]
MNETLKKILESIRSLWGKWTRTQKIILLGIAAAAAGGVVLLLAFSARPDMAELFSAPITDETVRENILFRLDQENVKATVSAGGIISVKDEQTARRMRAILMREDLVPAAMDPWSLFDIDRWTTTDFQNSVNLQRSITRVVTQHIESLDDIDRANVVITMPEKTLFKAEQDPVTASVVISPKPGSDITQNRKKIEGIQKLLLKAVTGLTADNLVISDQTGAVLNDFEGMKAFDAVALTEKQQRFISDLENRYKKNILATLQSIYGAKRVKDLNVKIEMDMDKVTAEEKTITPITIKADNPDTPYDDSDMLPSIVLSEQNVTKEWSGTALMPNGPAGTEGQNPPVYSDMNNMIGTSKENSVSRNYDYNTKVEKKEVSPAIKRFTVSVNIDGRWVKKYDDRGNLMFLANGSIDRDYIPLTSEEIANTAALVQDAIGYNRNRGDSVTVQNIAFDHTDEFQREDDEYIKRTEFRRTVYMVLGGIAAVLILFLLFRFIAKVRERRRRLKEEELLRQRQMERDKVLWESQQEPVEVSLSVEERRRTELQENAIAMAKEHPDDVAMLLRTWMMEE